MSGSLYDRIRFQRAAAAVERCHAKPHIKRYSVGGHTHDLVTLLVQTWRDAHNGELPRPELIWAAHTHDHPELIIGDLPSNVKSLIGSALNEVEARTWNWLRVDFQCLTLEEREWLEAADRMECWLWAWDELELGNNGVRDWIEAFDGKTLPPPFKHLWDAVLFHKGLRHPSNDMKQAIGGLS